MCYLPNQFITIFFNLDILKNFEASVIYKFLTECTDIKNVFVLFCFLSMKVL